MFTSSCRQSIRLAHTVSKKIPVQLLKDCGSIGRAGEVIRVKPAFMRNYLHVDNKACYITETAGPRIPVVERERKVKVKALKKKVVDTPAQDAVTKPVSFDELASLFAEMQGGAKPVVAATLEAAAASTDSYALSDLMDGLPPTFSLFDCEFPVSKEHLAQTVFNATGVNVPASVIRVRDKSGNTLEEVQAPGSYTWTFSSSESTGLVTKALRIH